MRFYQCFSTLILITSILFAEVEVINYTTEDGLPSNDVRAIHVHSDKSVWAATREGIAELTFGFWDTTSASGTNATNCKKAVGFATTSDDVLAFVGTFGYSYLGDDKIWEFTPYPPFDETIQSELVCLRNKLCFITEGDDYLTNQVSIIHEDGWYQTIGDQYVTSNFTDLVYESDSTILVTTKKGGIYRWSLEKQESCDMPHVDVAGAELVRFDNNGDLFSYHPGRGIFFHKKEGRDSLTLETGLFCDSTIVDIVVDRRWIFLASASKGIQALYDQEPVDLYTKETQGLLSDSIHDICFDFYGMIYAATDKGISHITYVPVPIVEQDKVVPHSPQLIQQEGRRFTFPTMTTGSATVGLYTLQGKLLEAQSLQFHIRKSVTFSPGASGVYMVQVQWQGRKISEKIFIE